MSKKDKLPDFFVSALVDILCIKKIDSHNVIQCLDWLIPKIDILTDSQIAEFVSRAENTFKVDSDGSLCMMSGNITPEERARWFRLYKKLQRLQIQRQNLNRHQLFQVA